MARTLHFLLGRNSRSGDSFSGGRFQRVLFSQPPVFRLSSCCFNPSLEPLSTVATLFDVIRTQLSPIRPAIAWLRYVRYCSGGFGWERGIFRGNYLECVLLWTQVEGGGFLCLQDSDGFNLEPLRPV